MSNILECFVSEFNKNKIDHERSWTVLQVIRNSWKRMEEQIQLIHNQYSLYNTQVSN